MNLSVGIVGLPNVGKSTLFNALLRRQVAHAANYPFATIEPNVGVVPVPDSRLEKLADIVQKEDSGQARMTEGKRPPIKPAMVNFVDIAGLVKGASEGAGLGNKFLSHIRECSVIAHVVRGFVDENVIREGSSDPESDYGIIQTELVLADLQTIVNSKLKSQKSKPQLKNQNFFSDVESNLNAGIPVRDMTFTDEEQEVIDQLFLLSAKPEIIVLNVSEDDYSLANISLLTAKYADLLQIPESLFVVICAKIESDLSNLTEDEQKEYLKELGLVSSGLERLIQKAYEELGLISFLTAGEKEVKAWTLPAGMTAVRASGVIHTDFEKKFIKAEVVSYENFVECKGWKGSREAGKARLEGRDYIMQDGDVVEFKIGA